MAVIVGVMSIVFRELVAVFPSVRSGRMRYTLDVERQHIDMQVTWVLIGVFVRIGSPLWTLSDHQATANERVIGPWQQSGQRWMATAPETSSHISGTWR